MKGTDRHLFNIRSSCPFWETLANIYLQRYSENVFALADTLFFLPNRRACQSLTAAFVRLQGLKPAILPRMTPVAEPDNNEVFFNGFSQHSFFSNQKKIISKEERLFILSRLIVSKPNDFGLKQISQAQALSLAGELASLMDTAANQGLSFDKLQDLVPDKYASHWQDTLKLLKIITSFWPEFLAEQDATDCCTLKNNLLFQQAEMWKKNPTKQNIVAAGITACFPSVTALLLSILNLPNGEIYFAGLDRYADKEYWNAVDETHPQYELKSLLNILNITRNDVQDVFAPFFLEKEYLISEIMRPASVSDKWRKLPADFKTAEVVKGISIIECDTQRDEALAIALQMRSVLSIPEATAALITYDRNLARRVASELKRFNIQIDDSAGLPLNLTPIGIFLRLTAEAAFGSDSETLFISLLKHPFMLCGEEAASFRKKTYLYETALRKKNIYPVPPELSCFAARIKQLLEPLKQALNESRIKFSSILELHIRLAEKLSSSPEDSVNKKLWTGEAGKCAAAFITKILTAADALGYINGCDYIPLLCELMSAESVRTSYGTHPRLSILGPIEARLCHFDYVILGEFNEGIWPKSTQADMWMSRPMKKDFGFDLPEKAIGILGADLCGFLAAENVVITRADRVDGTPMKKSRWLLRFETVLTALNFEAELLKNKDFYHLANKLDLPQKLTPIQPPAPCPPLWARPRQLSASGVDLLIHDPYSVFAKYILKLYPLDDLDKMPDQRDYGTLVHAIIEDFNNLYPSAYPNNAPEILSELATKHFNSASIPKELEAFWKPKFEKTIAWLVLQEKEYRQCVKKVHNETKGSVTYHLEHGDFTFTAKADRIDELKNGQLNILDYKTGNIPNKKQVMSGHALQLPIEGLIAQDGAFENISGATVCDFIYWQLGCKALQFSSKEDNILEKSKEYLLKLVNTFDFETTPYYSRPTPHFIPKNRDYEHLARIQEWSVQEKGDGNDE